MPRTVDPDWSNPKYLTDLLIRFRRTIENPGNYALTQKDLVTNILREHGILPLTRTGVPVQNSLRLWSALHAFMVSKGGEALAEPVRNKPVKSATTGRE